MEEKHPRWGARTSNPAEGVHDVFGEFDSHLFRPPSTFVVVPASSRRPYLQAQLPPVRPCRFCLQRTWRHHWFGAPLGRAITV